MFDNNCTLSDSFERDHSLTAKLSHHAHQFAASVLGQQVAVEGFAGQRAGYCAIRTDQPEIEPKLLGDRQGESVAPAGDENDLDSLGDGRGGV